MMVLLLTLLAGCSTDPCAGTRDLANSPDGLQLTEVEHPVGWGHTDCFQCHQRWKLHADSCIVGVDVHGDEIQPETTADCVECHGWNGVPEWLDTDSDSDTDASGQP